MEKMETLLTGMLGIKYPIIAAPMFLVSYEELVVAVSEAGGLGCLPLPNYGEIDTLKRAFDAIRRATEKPIGVNIHLSGKFAWKEQLSLCLDAGVRFFITSLGDPRLIIDEVHEKGGKVFADVISLEQGYRAGDRGVDGLIAVASGAGGHCGTIPTMILVPYLKEKVGLPVVAAGGISTGAQMAAAIALGACGVIVGTRFIATDESRAMQEYKDTVISMGPEDIVCTDRISGNRANWIARSIEGLESGPDIESRKWLEIWSAGQSVAQVEKVKPAGEVISEMVGDYLDACERLQRTI
jgi:nitronate monooxygenase